MSDLQAFQEHILATEEYFQNQYPAEYTNYFSDIVDNVDGMMDDWHNRALLEMKKQFLDSDYLKSRIDIRNYFYEERNVEVDDE